MTPGEPLPPGLPQECEDELCQVINVNQKGKLSEVRLLRQSEHHIGLFHLELEQDDIDDALGRDALRPGSGHF